MAVLQIQLSEKLFLKDPQSTDLGKRIIKASISLIDTIGFEAFTFKKLSVEIDSTEASIYRYFENKHRILLYMITWYWAWLEYRIEFETYNIQDAKVKLETALRIVCLKNDQDIAFPDIDEVALQRIVIGESDKVYLTKQVDSDNKVGLFKGYKSLCRQISEIIKTINQSYPYPNALASTILEAANQQVFFARHLPSLTESSKAEDPFSYNFSFLKSLVFNAIEVE
ncbi:MAG: TetR/AcrR family transcriptional regulator [Cyclobacteriaceae bacterium]